MSDTETSRPASIPARLCKPLIPLLFVLLLGTVPLAWADGNTPPAQITAGETLPASSGEDANGKEHDLAGFFTIGAIINVLFLGAFIAWARKESQKGKQKKTGEKA